MDEQAGCEVGAEQRRVAMSGGRGGWSRRVVSASLLLGAGLLRAQTAVRPYRLGILWHAESPEGEGLMFTAVIGGLREQGLVEGRNLVVEHRFAAERPERFTSMASELVAWKPDVLMTLGPQAAVAMKNTGTRLPFVFAAVGDPVRLGLVQSWGRPGTNCTGFSVLGPNLVAKQLQLVVESLPNVRRVGFLHNPASPIASIVLGEAKDASARLGVAVVPSGARDSTEITGALAKFAEAGIQSAFAFADGLIWRERSLIAAECVARGIAMTGGYREMAEAGMLMSYGPSLPDSARQATGYVRRILEGASPAELPVVGPTRFELVLNLKTARTLGLRIPSAIMVRADATIG